jgi:hypothetical protein
LNTVNAKLGINGTIISRGRNVNLANVQTGTVTVNLSLPVVIVGH